MSRPDGGGSERHLRPRGDRELAGLRDALAERGLELWQQRRSRELARPELHPWRHLRGRTIDPDLERQGLHWQAGVGYLRKILAVTDDGWVFVLGNGGAAVLEPECGEIVGQVVFSALYSCVSDDGRLLVVGAGHRLSCWNLESATLQWERWLEDEVMDLALSPDGTTVVVGWRRHLLLALEVSDARLRWQVGLPTHCSALAFSPSGAFLAMGTSEGRLLTFGAQDGRLAWEAETDLPVAHLAFSPDGTWLAALTRRRHRRDLEGAFLLYAGADGQLFWRTEGGSVPSAVAFAPDGRHLALHLCSGRQPFPIRPKYRTQLLRARDGSLVWEAETIGTSPRWTGALAFSPGGEFLAVPGHRGLSVLNVADGQPTWQAEFNGFVRFTISALRFSPTGTRLVALADGHKLSVFEARAGRPLWHIEHLGVEWAGFSPNGTVVAVFTASGCLSVHRADDGHLLWQSNKWDQEIENLVFSPDGSRLAATVRDPWERLLVYAVEDGQLLTETLASTVAFGSAGETVVARRVGDGSAIHVYCPETDLIILEAHVDAEVESLTLSPDGALLAATSPGEILIYSVKDGRRRWAHELGESWWSLAWSPNSTSLATWKRGRLVVYRAEDGRLCWQAGLDAEVDRLAFSPDGALVAVSTRKGRLLVLDAVGGTCRWDATVEGSISELAFSPDGARLAIVYYDYDDYYIIRRDCFLEYAAKDGRPLRQLELGTSVESLSYSPDGSRLVVAGDFGLQMWDVLGMAE